MAQVFRIERQRTNLQGEKEEVEVAFGITSLSTEKANPSQLLAFNRNHWSIENKVHYVRDVTFDEDRSRVRKKVGPQVMASLRNLTISVLRMAGASNIAKSLRACSWKSRPLLALPGHRRRLIKILCRLFLLTTLAALAVDLPKRRTPGLTSNATSSPAG
jgi:predicted transposase YbfD/YdcC